MLRPVGCPVLKRAGRVWDEKKLLSSGLFFREKMPLFGAGKVMKWSDEIGIKRGEKGKGRDWVKG